MDETLRIADSRGFCVRALHGRCALGGALRILLLPASWVYGGIGLMRRRAYGMGILRTHKLPIPVISVGNITTGGTGKTPMVEWVVRALRKAGLNPAILSRGYGAIENNRNDEAITLSINLPDTIHIVNPDRVAGGCDALEAGADCIVLDDGFQHMRLHRDLNIVLIDALNPFGGGAVLPSGLLREPLSALRAADAVIITHADTITPSALQKIRKRIMAHSGDVLIAEAVHSPTALDGPDGTAMSPEALQGKKVFAFCAIGNPEAFHETIRSLGAQLVGARNFTDHYGYTPRDLHDMAKAARKAGAEMMITTQKDAVKIPQLCSDHTPTTEDGLMLQPLDAPTRVLRIEFDIRSGGNQLIALIRRECAQ